jgi:hypothetical protein
MDYDNRRPEVATIEKSSTIGSVLDRRETDSS